jgi:hypothetical protein
MPVDLSKIKYKDATSNEPKMMFMTGLTPN